MFLQMMEMLGERQQAERRSGEGHAFPSEFLIERSRQGRADRATDEHQRDIEGRNPRPDVIRQAIDDPLGGDLMELYCPVEHDCGDREPDQR